MTHLVVRSDPAPCSDYRDYREPLRADFWFSCAYCTVTEIEAGGVRFTIDHYVPQSEDLSLLAEYSNLMWCCDHCNELKLDLVSRDAAQLAGDRILRPDEDDQADHMEIDDLSLKPLTRPGNFTIVMLALNRKPLRDLRMIRRSLHDSEEHIRRGLAGLRSLSIEQLPVAVRGRYLAALGELNKTSDEIYQQGSLIMERILRTFGRSVMLDTDPDAEARASARRAFLNELKAIHVDSFRGRKSRKPGKRKSQQTGKRRR